MIVLLICNFYSPIPFLTAFYFHFLLLDVQACNFFHLLHYLLSLGLALELFLLSLGLALQPAFLAIFGISLGVFLTIFGIRLGAYLSIFRISLAASFSCYLWDSPWSLGCCLSNFIVSPASPRTSNNFQYHVLLLLLCYRVILANSLAAVISWLTGFMWLPFSLTYCLL